ncbi:hypothetical protein [Aquariibacter albus]|uniref:Uncharacterized protein n=1 Tax=Aquariibacter albus TaxID=2759899 RepID=A0A839HTP9_9BURK|nr:hypothetical protein [Aquariibacter albus]MBB1162671.1 hypothetical protein [Aquariibacter albus]
MRNPHVPETADDRQRADAEESVCRPAVQCDEAAAFNAECIAIGRESAAAGFRIVPKLPTAYQDAFDNYRGPEKKPSYFESKLLSLRLSALRRGMVVDSAVTIEFLQRITVAQCPVQRKRFRLKSGSSERNPSLDRLVNEVTYRAGNICALTQQVNRVKGDLSFDEVLQVAQARKDHAGLMPAEWLRLASLMYGAWARAYKQDDLYLLPLAAIPGPGMFMSTSQAVQLLLTRHFSKGGNASAATGLWLGLTRQSDCKDDLFLEFRVLLAAALSEERYPEDVWQRDAVFGTFARWYLACRDAVDAQVEVALHRHHERLADPAAELDWPAISRYQH